MVIDHVNFVLFLNKFLIPPVVPVKLMLSRFILPLLRSPKKPSEMNSKTFFQKNNLP